MRMHKVIQKNNKYLTCANCLNHGDCSFVLRLIENAVRNKKEQME